MASTEYSNRLAQETSPYLLQHAHQPVDWYPWGAEALDKARLEDKPIFLSIGYSACHWCHVMSRECFDNEELARQMNERFINIKVDREERPEIDAIYMNALIAMNGQGGWPLNLFLTPDQKPYLGGTYFPPVPEITNRVLEKYSDRPMTSTGTRWSKSRAGLMRLFRKLIRGIFPVLRMRTPRKN